MPATANKVRETTTATGSGDDPFALAGAVGGYRTFVAGVGDGASVVYSRESADGSTWEIRRGVVTDASPDTITPGTLLDSSTGSTITWTAGHGVQSVRLVADADDYVSRRDDNTFSGNNLFPNGGVRVLDTDASHALEFWAGSDLSANRKLTITTGDADRTLTLSGNATLSGGTHSGTNTGDQTTSGTADRITVTTGSGNPVIDIAATYVGQNTITTLGTVTTGTWSATTVAVNKGGTGQTSYTNGQLLIGNTTGNTLAKGTLTGTANQITVTNGGGSITLSAPQDLHTSATPQFAGIGIGTAGVADQINLVGGLGQFLISSSATDSTQKNSRFGTLHYLSAEEPVYIFSASNSASHNDISFGGSSGAGNAATRVHFYAAANNTTTTGTRYMHLDGPGGGNIIVGGTLGSPSSATKNLVLSAGSTSPVLGAATADAVSIAGVDNGAGNREFQVQPESGGILAFGANVLRTPGGGLLSLATRSSAGTANGDLWSDSNQKAVQAFAAGVEQTLSGVIATETATATVSNTASETTLIPTVAGTASLPANFFVVGKKIRVRLGAIFSTPAVLGNVVFNAYLGSNLVASITLSDLDDSATNQPIDFYLEICCHTAGASGVVRPFGRCYYRNSGSAYLLIPFPSGNGAVSLDTTAAQAFDLKITWDAATSSRTITTTAFSLEVLN